MTGTDAARTRFDGWGRAWQLAGRRAGDHDGAAVRIDEAIDQFRAVIVLGKFETQIRGLRFGVVPGVALVMRAVFVRFVVAAVRSR